MIENFTFYLSLILMIIELIMMIDEEVIRRHLTELELEEERMRFI